jgi:hypothetical protein
MKIVIPNPLALSKFREARLSRVRDLLLPVADRD